MVFFQPSDAARPDFTRALEEELAVFDRGAPGAQPFARANRPETRARTRLSRASFGPMIFDDEAAEAAEQAAEVPALTTAPASETALEPTPAPAPASAVGVWRLPRLHPHEQRILADSNDRRAWLEHRAAGVTATDAAKLATEASVRQVVKDKVRGSSFGGNAYTDFGREREPHIAAWVAERHGVEPCGLLFHAEEDRRHLATPDGLYCDDDGRVILAEIKTTNKPWSRIPRNYLRQVWWQQYVLGAERTLFVWERHKDFVVVDEEPRFVWIERDDAEIERMRILADRVLAEVESLRAHLG